MFLSSKTVYIAYLDDSRHKDFNDQKSFQLIGAVIIRDASFRDVERHFGYTIQELEPDNLPAGFEFHAADLMNGKKPFENIKRDRAIEILQECLVSLQYLDATPIIYGCVDLNKHRKSLYTTANPADVAFRLCALGIEEWFSVNAPDELGIFISDNSDKNTRESAQSAFHQFRERVDSSPAIRGELEHIVDDMYFGDSKYSVGIQLADVCTYLIGRHLVGHSETEDLYHFMEKRIFKGIIEPKE